MSKTAFVFPGQGAQYVGMARDFYESVPASKRMFELASESSGLDIPALCFEENDNINITEYTQIAILAAEAAILEAVREKGVEPFVTAGLSLGEYGALLVSGAMTAKDAFSVVRKRGIFMQEAVPTGGAMTAVLGLDPAAIEEVCEETAKTTGGIVSVANYNCPGQSVITGEKAAVDKAAEALSAKGAKRCIPLKVSGPFHSAMLKGAGDKLGEVLSGVTVSEIKTPYIANVTADYVRSAADVKDLLTRQVSSPVRWQQSVERMLADGVDTFVEIGPGKTLTGFMKKINREVKCINIEKLEDLENL